MKCCIDSLYIIVDDLERATNFYEDFLLPAKYMF